jgi:hypothetical protein
MTGNKSDAYGVFAKCAREHARAGVVMVSPDLLKT